MDVLVDVEPKARSDTYLRTEFNFTVWPQLLYELPRNGQPDPRPISLGFVVALVHLKPEQTLLYVLVKANSSVGNRYLVELQTSPLPLLGLALNLQCHPTAHGKL